MKRKMIELFISEIASYNRMIENGIATDILKSEYSYIKGQQSMLEEIGLEVLMHMHDELTPVVDVFIDDVKYMYIHKDRFYKLEK